MARKKRTQNYSSAGPAGFEKRIQRALREGRLDSALELTRQQYDEAPTPAHQEVFQKLCLNRGRQLRLKGHTAEALVVLEEGMHLVATDRAWLDQVAEELAAAGGVRQALALVEAQVGSPVHGRVLARAADVAVQRETVGRQLLPESLHADFDRVMQASAQLEAGQDEAARATLQGIGLRSPFLEWKLLLRGLQAYYQKDDTRALENWQRLNPERLPAELAAPLRFRLDPAFRLAQSSAAQASLQKRADRLEGIRVVQELRSIQAALAAEESMARAFRLAEAALPALQESGPHLVQRLAACFYWTLVARGQAEDVPRYQRVFGAPADDPQLARLRALLLEHQQEWVEAHEHWQKFEKSVAAATAWSAEQKDRVRALVFFRMGRNADRARNQQEVVDLLPFRSPRPRRSRGFVTATTESCYQNSLKLAPDLLEAHVHLFDHYREHDEVDKAEKTARRLLEHFSEHGPTLEALGDLFMAQGRYSEGLDLFQRARAGNPLKQELRRKVATAHLFRARSHTEAGRFEEARADFQASLGLRDGQDYSVLCKWAACEFKAGNPERAEGLLNQARTSAGSALAIAFNVVIEVIRLKLPRPLKQRFDRDFNAALAEQPTGEGAAGALGVVIGHRRANVTYHGQKTHEKKILGYVEKARRAEFSESQLRAVCQGLLELGALKLADGFAVLGQERFPENPHFFLLEVECHMALGPERCPLWRVHPLLEKARRLAEALPRDPTQQALLESIQEREEMIRAVNPLLDMMKGNFDPFGDEEGEDEDSLDDEW